MTMTKRRHCGTIAGTAWCDGCQETVDVRLVDDGVGRTEYCGSVDVHHDWGFECSVCGGHIDGKAVTEQENTRDYGDD